MLNRVQKSHPLACCGLGQVCLHCLKGALLTNIHLAACQGPHVLQQSCFMGLCVHVVQLVPNSALLCNSRHLQPVWLEWCWVMTLETGGAGRE